MVLAELLDPGFPNLRWLPIILGDWLPSVPIFAIVEYFGYQVSCVGLLPLNSSLGLCYGSADGGRHVFKDASIAEDVESLARMLNLAPHVVGQNRVTLSHCADIEVHKGTDNTFYIIDSARCVAQIHWLFLLTDKNSAPRVSESWPTQEHFLLLSSSRVCSTLSQAFVFRYAGSSFCFGWFLDALSIFLKDDPNKQQFNDDIRDATTYLINITIPLACIELDRRLDFQPHKSDHSQVVCDLEPTSPFTIMYTMLALVN